MAISTLNKFTVPLASNQSNATQGMLMPKLKYRFRVLLINFGATDAPPTEITKQVKDITRPTIAFEPITLDVYNSRIYLPGKHTWTALTLTLRDDVLGGASKLVGTQLQRQFDFFEQASAASGGDYKFTTRIEILDGGNGAAGSASSPNVLETWECYGCYLENVNYQNLSYTENAEVTLTCSIKYDAAAQMTGGAVGNAVVPRGTGTMATG